MARVLNGMYAVILPLGKDSTDSGSGIICLYSKGSLQLREVEHWAVVRALFRVSKSTSEYSYWKNFTIGRGGSMKR